MSSGLVEALFARRGLVLAVPAILVALLGSPSVAGFLPGLPFLSAGLVLRAWAVSHIGPGSRTNKTEAPLFLTRSGPYGWLLHPLYCANYSVSLGFLLWLRPPNVVALGLATGILVFYWLLSERETAINAGIPVGRQPKLTGLQLIRCERSTWLSWTALVLVSSLPV